MSSPRIPTPEEPDLLERVLRAHLPYLDEDAPLEPDASLTGLGLDSIGTMELLATLEETFEMRFPEEALTVTTFATPASIRAVLSGAA